MPLKDETMKAYDAIAGVYEDYSKTRLAYLSSIESLVVDMLKPSYRLLDIGSGDGRRLEIITSRAGIKDFVAVEPSEGMAKICKELIGKPVYRVFANQIDSLDLGVFDIITALWNVFGHMPDEKIRIEALQKMKSKLSSDGFIILDVNNRHNASAYGYFSVLNRKIVDTFFFDEKRGDAKYDWKIDGEIFKSSGHLFTPEEIEMLFKKAGLKVIRRYAVDYKTGKISKIKFRGQLLYILGIKD